MKLIVILLFIIFLTINYFQRNITIFSKYKWGQCDTHARFCNVKKIYIDVPQYVYTDVMDAIKYKKRKNTFGKKSSTVNQSIIIDKYPNIIHFFNSEALKTKLASELHLDIQPTSIDDPLSCMIIIYDKKGDKIDWHYDNNIYKGRLFTVLVCIHHGNNTCAQFEYKDNNEKIHTISLRKFEAVILEGENVFHRITKACDDETRIVLSMTFTTNKETTMLNNIYKNVKQFYFY